MRCEPAQEKQGNDFNVKIEMKQNTMKTSVCSFLSASVSSFFMCAHVYVRKMHVCMCVCAGARASAHKCTGVPALRRPYALHFHRNMLVDSEMYAALYGTRTFQANPRPLSFYLPPLSLVLFIHNRKVCRCYSLIFRLFFFECVCVSFGMSVFVIDAVVVVAFRSLFHKI